MSKLDLKDFTTEEIKILTDLGLDESRLRKGIDKDEIQKHARELILDRKLNESQVNELKEIYKKTGATSPSINEKPSLAKQNSINNRHQQDIVQPTAPLQPVIIVKLAQGGLPIPVSASFRQQMLSNVRGITNTTSGSAPRAVGFILKNTVAQGLITGNSLESQKQATEILHQIPHHERANAGVLFLNFPEEAMEKIKKSAKELGFHPENIKSGIDHKLSSAESAVPESTQAEEPEEQRSSIFKLRPHMPGTPRE